MTLNVWRGGYQKLKKSTWPRASAKKCSKVLETRFCYRSTDTGQPRMCWKLQWGLFSYHQQSKMNILSWFFLICLHQNRRSNMEFNNGSVFLHLKILKTQIQVFHRTLNENSELSFMAEQHSVWKMNVWKPLHYLKLQGTLKIFSLFESLSEYF